LRMIKIIVLLQSLGSYWNLVYELLPLRRMAAENGETNLQDQG